MPNETTYRTYENIYELADSMTVNVVFHSDDPNVGLALTKDTSRYKLFLGDTGLFVTQVFMDKDATDNVIYNKLLSDKLDTNLGYNYENMVSQIFRASGYELFYHTIKKNEGKSYYEVDFLLSKGNKLIPIEVKSSGYKSHTSLDRFCEKFSDRICKKIPYLYHRPEKGWRHCILANLYGNVYINHQKQRFFSRGGGGFFQKS